MKQFPLLELYQSKDIYWYVDPETGPKNIAWFVFTFIVAGALYYAGYQLSKRTQSRKAWTTVIGGSLLCGLILMFTYPFGSGDVFDNIVHARILVKYQANPFTETGQQYPQDPFVPYMGWKEAPSAYGPLWELTAGMAVLPLGDGILVNVLAFKLLPGLFLLGTTIVLGLISHRADPENSLSRVLLFAWNPVVLYETWVHGHNDLAMAFWIVLAVWAMQVERYKLGVLALVIGALYKYIPLLLLPAAVLTALKRLPDRRSRLRFLGVTAAASAAMIVLAYLPFWDGLSTLTADRRMVLYTTSLPAVAFQSLSLNMDTERAGALVSTVATGLAGVFALAQGGKAYLAGSWQGFSRASFNTLAFYLLFTCLWFQPWYALWLLALAPVVFPGSFALHLAILLGFSAQSKQFFIGPMLLWTSHGLEQPWFELLYTLGVLGPAWIFLIIVLVRSLRRRREKSVKVSETYKKCERL